MCTHTHTRYPGSALLHPGAQRVHALSTRAHAIIVTYIILHVSNKLWYIHNYNYTTMQLYNYITV